MMAYVNHCGSVSEQNWYHWCWSSYDLGKTKFIDHVVQSEKKYLHNKQVEVHIIERNTAC